MAYLFLFAHQDDEYGIFHCIHESVQNGHEVYCAYLTDGGCQSGRRNKESMSVLKSLGVSEKKIFYPGSELKLHDGKLHKEYEKALKWIVQWLSSHTHILTVYAPAWEGGHPDHDILHALAVRASGKISASIRVMQYSLYNGCGCVGQLFRVLSPLPQNGIPVTLKIPIRNRLKFLRLCLSYSSQRKTWIGLFPFVFLHYLFRGTQSLQLGTEERLLERPHEGILYYERRKFSTWEEISGIISKDTLI